MATLVGLTAARTLVARNVLANKRYFSKLIFDKLMKPAENQALLCNAPRQQMQQQRFKGGECEKKLEEDDCSRLACKSSSSGDDGHKKPKKKCSATSPDDSNLSQAATNPTKCMYDDPECCLDKCPDANIRLDCLYYKMSDKKARKYQQTWVDCPPVRKVPKVTCANPFIEREAPLPIRGKDKPKPKTACSIEGEDAALMECSKQDKKGACIKIRMFGCRSARDPPKCKTIRAPKDCRKIKCPYPAFSECSKPKPRNARPNECSCLEVRTMCDIYALAKKKGMKLPKN